LRILEKSIIIAPESVFISKYNKIIFMKKINDPQEAFVLKLQTLYDIETQLEKALPKMAKASADPELKEGFMMHLDETQEHSQRLEQIFAQLDSTPKKLKSEGIRGIIEDGEWIMKAEAPETLKDAMIAGAARHAEHYEISGYLGAIEEARALGLDQAVELLSETLAEEENADRTLSEAVKKSLGTA
jgi:ferritin-like metal-binding protein YciE